MINRSRPDGRIDPGEKSYHNPLHDLSLAADTLPISC